MKRIRRAFTTLLLVASVFTTSVLAAPNVNELEDKKDKAESEMQQLQNELTAIMTQINQTEQELVETGGAIIDATKRLEEAEKNEKQQHDNMVKRIVAMYETGSGSLLQIIMESGSIAEMLQRMENVQAVHEYDRKELEKYIAVKEEIVELKATLEEKQASLEELQTQLAKQEKELTNKISAKKKEVADFEAQIEKAAREAAEEANKQVIVGSGYVGNGDQSVGNAIVAAARTYIGVWYLWGGNDYDGIDCSGLTKAAHAAVGIRIDRWSGHQAIGGKKVDSLEEARPGDIICYPGHVAIYIGNYRVIHAPRTGKQVQEATVYLKEITAIRRYW